MYQFVELTDGTTTATLTDMVVYVLTSLDLGVATLRDGELGGEGPYDDVTTKAIFHVRGTSAADAYAAIDAVNKLLDNARRWWRGDSSVALVKLRVQIQNSTLPILECVIKGRAPGGPPNIRPQITWNQNLCLYISEDVEIEFVRRGQLLGATETLTTSGFVNNGDVMGPGIGTFTPLDGLHPTRYRIGGLTRATTPYVGPGFFLVANSSGKFVILEAESLTWNVIAKGGAVGSTASVADVLNNARGGSIRRLTATTAGTGLTYQGIGNLTITFARSARFACVFANVKNTGFGATCQAQAQIVDASGSVISSAPAVPIEVDGAARWYNLGLIAMPPPNVSGSNGGTVNVLISTTIGGGVTFDIDSIVVFGITSETDKAIGIGASYPLGIPAPTNRTVAIEINHQLITAPDTRVVTIATDGVDDLAGVDYRRGDVVCITSPASPGGSGAPSGLWLVNGSEGGGSGTGGNYWRYSPGGVLFQATLEAQRRLAYVVPR
jgi:hypothetical protein